MNSESLLLDTDISIAGTFDIFHVGKSDGIELCREHVDGLIDVINNKLPLFTFKHVTVTRNVDHSITIHISFNDEHETFNIKPHEFPSIIKGYKKLKEKIANWSDF